MIVARQAHCTSLPLFDAMVHVTRLLSLSAIFCSAFLQQFNRIGINATHAESRKVPSKVQNVKLKGDKLGSGGSEGTALWEQSVEN